MTSRALAFTLASGAVLLLNTGYAIAADLAATAAGDSTVDGASSEASGSPDMDAASADAGDGAASGDIMDLPPEDFFNLDLSVYSPAKKIQKLRNTPQAVYVLTSEDIRRSGADNIIDVFRLVPGIEVARVSAHEWAITARGFNQVFGNKILLLIDGAPVETPIFNGILWENINIPLDVIERIEFLRGPGASTWGTRAMNGVINVITKDAFTYPHNRVAVGGGSEHLGSAYARLGSVLSEKAAVQGYVKVDKYDGSEDPGGHRLDDNWEIFTANIRGDLRPTKDDEIRVNTHLSSRQADFQLTVPAFNETFSEEIHDQRDNHRASLAVLWNRRISDTSSVALEWTNLYEQRKDALLDLKSFYSDIELRHRVQLWDWNDLTYGANVRFYSDDTEGSETLRFEPENRSLEYYRLFIHDELTLLPKLLTLTLGSRFEENAQFGFDALPTARVLYSPTDRVSLWGGWSYTTGSPARVYDDIRLNATAFPEETTGLPALVQVTGNRQLDSEELTAYEVGAWIEPIEKLYTSITGFYFRYDDLVDYSTGDPELVADGSMGMPYLLIPLQYSNAIEAESMGVEIAIDWNVVDWFGFGASYSYFNLTTDGPTGSTTSEALEDNPRSIFSLRSHFNPLSTVELDFILRSVDVYRPSGSVLHNYVEGDARIGWRVYHDLDLELIGRNLFDNSHREIDAVVFNTPPSEVERSLFLSARYTF